MPFINLHNEPLTVNLPDLIQGQTAVARKAVNIRLIYDIDTEFVNIKWVEVKCFKNEDGTCGTVIGQEEKVLTAKTDVLVDVTDGTQLATLATEYLQDGEEKVLNPILVGKNYAIESKYYNHIANSVAVVVNQIIAARIVKNYTP